jgi:hypothetical protein
MLFALRRVAQSTCVRSTARSTINTSRRHFSEEAVAAPKKGFVQKLIDPSEWATSYKRTVHGTVRFFMEKQLLIGYGRNRVLQDSPIMLLAASLVAIMSFGWIARYKAQSDFLASHPEHFVWTTVSNWRRQHWSGMPPMMSTKGDEPKLPENLVELE